MADNSKVVSRVRFCQFSDVARNEERTVGRREQRAVEPAARASGPRIKETVTLSKPIRVVDLARSSNVDGNVPLNPLNPLHVSLSNCNVDNVDTSRYGTALAGVRNSSPSEKDAAKVAMIVCGVNGGRDVENVGAEESCRTSQLDKSSRDDVADRARKIKNKPIVNQDPKVAKFNRLNKLIQELRLALMNQELGVTCPKEHEALEEKYRLLQQKLRDMTDKLNSNLEEFVVMHERAEMAEQARKKIRLALALLLVEFSQVLQDFSTCRDIDDEQCNKLKAMYDKMLDIQNDERKASEQLINHEISNSKNCGAHMAENVEECVRAEASSNGVEDSLDYFDQKGRGAHVAASRAK